MKKAQGFTLVELLVVIVIIGILATGAISMFTGAQQKARDSVRLTDVQAVKLAVEQSYGDKALYPQALASDTNGLGLLTKNGYIDRLPSDPKTAQKTNTSMFYYVYGAKEDAGTKVGGQEFELSALFENAGNTENKSKNDSGDDDLRWETGVNIDGRLSTGTPAGSDGVLTTINQSGTLPTNTYSSSVASQSATIIDNL